MGHAINALPVAPHPVVPKIGFYFVSCEKMVLTYCSYVSNHFFLLPRRIAILETTGTLAGNCPYGSVGKLLGS